MNQEIGLSAKPLAANRNELRVSDCVAPFQSKHDRPASHLN
jgi:hypothetical protein